MTLLVCFRFNQLAFAVFLTLPYTLAVYMVRDFEGDKGTEGSVGRDTGLLVSQLLLGHQLQNTGTALQLVQGACRLLQLLQPSV